MPLQRSRHTEDGTIYTVMSRISTNTWDPRHWSIRMQQERCLTFYFYFFFAQGDIITPTRSSQVKERLCDSAKVTQKTVTELGAQPAPHALSLTPRALCFPKSAFPLLLRAGIVLAGPSSALVVWCGIGNPNSEQLLLGATSTWRHLGTAKFCSPERSQTQAFCRIFAPLGSPGLVHPLSP